MYRVVQTCLVLDGSRPANCFVSPCSSQKCAAFPNARCIEDYCGGCTAHFFDEQLNEISKNRCLETPASGDFSTVATPPPFNIQSKTGFCPQVRKFTGSPPCQKSCDIDSDCLSTLKCCETTCGRTCIEADQNDSHNISPWIAIGSPSQSSSLFSTVNRADNHGENPCKSSPCGYCQLCIQEAKQCLTTPCPQFRCEGFLTNSFEFMSFDFRNFILL